MTDMEKLERRVADLNGQYSKNVLENSGVDFIDIICSFMVDDMNEIYGFNGKSHKKLQIDEGRELFLEIYEPLNKQIVNDEEIKNYLKYLHEKFNYSNNGSKKMLGPNNISFRITFWDETMNRYPPPYLSQISLVRGKVFYHYCNPKTQALTEPIIESIEEVFNISKKEMNEELE